MFEKQNKNYRTMKWTTLLKDIRDKVGLSSSQSSTSSSSGAAAAASSSSSVSDWNSSSAAQGDENRDNAAHHRRGSSSSSRDKHELELDFKRSWEEFRSSSSEKEKEAALNMTVDVFCRLVLVETHIFSFVVGRAFVTDIEKLKISNKSRSLDLVELLRFFSEVTKDGINPGSNLLTAVEVLVSGPTDKQSLLDSGIFCCLIHILSSLVGTPESNVRRRDANDNTSIVDSGQDSYVTQARRLEAKGKVVHIMKALACHPSAAQNLIEDNSLQLLFHLVVNGSLKYKKVLREVGVLEVLLDDLKHSKFISGSDPQNMNDLESSFKKHLDSKDTIISSPKLMDSGSGKFPLFESEGTIAIAWDCMVSLLKKSEGNQSSFRSANGMMVVLPLLVSDTHRQGVLRALSCLMVEDVSQTHPEELGSLLEVLKSGMVTSVSGPQYRLDGDAKCDIFGALWRILGANAAAQRVFGEATGFSLLLTTLSSFQGDGGLVDQSGANIKMFTYLLRVVTAGVEGKVVHIMKALASHPSAAQSLIEDTSLQLLFHLVVNGSLKILGLLLVNDNGSTAKYIRKHQLIKVLLTAIKDFHPDSSNAAYTMGIVDLLLECVELSYKPDSGGVRLREDIHNAHGYQFLVQFALTLSGMSKSGRSQPPDSSSLSSLVSTSDGSHDVSSSGRGEPAVDGITSTLSPALSRLLDVLVTLAHTGPADTAGMPASKASHAPPAKGGGHNRSRTPSVKFNGGEIWDKSNTKIKDLEAVQMLQDIFLKANSIDLQAEVLNRMFKLFSSHIENYKLCQQLRTVPLFILNMAGFPPSLQEVILKILEYAVTVVNCIPEQELLSLCCLLQQQITSESKKTILSFFVKLLSFDQQYKKVLREVGVLEVLLDDLKHNKYFSGSDPQNMNDLESNFKKHLDSKDTIISSPKLMDSGSGKFPLFESDSTIAIAWDCMVSLLKKAEGNQSSFRAANGVMVVLPFLVSDTHRQGVLRALSCLMVEDVSQAHPEELGSLLEVLKSGMVTSVSGPQYRLDGDAKCDIFGALWRILGANAAAQRVFGEATGFSLLLTTINSFQGDGGVVDQSGANIKMFTYLLRVVTAGVCDNAINRGKLHTIIFSNTFCELLCDSGLLCVDYEKQVLHLLFELGLEIVLPPFLASESSASYHTTESSNFVLSSPSGLVNPQNERVYNAAAIRVIIRALLLFTPKTQLEVLELIEKLAHAGPFNQENLTAVGCIELLLEMIHPFLSGSSPLLSYAFRIVEVLGAYRLSTSEVRLLLRYILQVRCLNSGRNLVDMVERLVLKEDMALNSVSLAPFVEMDMSRLGHACIQVSLGERSWPPVAGYSFVCWFQYQNFLEPQGKEYDSKAVSRKQGIQQQQILRLFSVGSVDGGNTFYVELYLQEDGFLTLATSSSSSPSFSCLELEEGRWHHLVIVHSKPNALAGLFQSSVAHIYINGKLRHTGRLGYSPSPVGKQLKITVGTPATRAKVGELRWKLRSCYLFEEVLTPGCICFIYILGRGYRGLFQDTDLLQFVPNRACGGDSMAILDSLEADLSSASGSQKSDHIAKPANNKAEGSGIVWDMERLGNLSLQLSGKKLIFAFDGTSTEAIRASGTFSLLNLVDPASAAASPIGGIPRFGRLYGDIYLCRQCVIGDTIHPVGGMIVVLALVEAAETRDMLHMALTLLACSLDHNPQNIEEMQACRGYHLLSLFLHRRMSMFDMHCLEIFFKIAACEASFSEPKRLESSQTSFSPSMSLPESSIEDVSLSKFRDELSSFESHGDIDDFSAHKDTYSHISELENADVSAESSNCIVLSNADMVEHVLLDWTLWVTAPVPIQIALLGFLEHLVSIHWYRFHNFDGSAPNKSCPTSAGDSSEGRCRGACLGEIGSLAWRHSGRWICGF
ncbi:SPIRRIG-like protein [Drosera capensis]